MYAVASAIVTYLCVRGRIATAWISTAATIVVALYWSLRTGQGVTPGLTISIFTLGPLAMGTVFSFTLRPAARTVFELRAQATDPTRQMITKCYEKGRVVYTQTGACTGSMSAVPIDTGKNVVGPGGASAPAGGSR